MIELNPQYEAIFNPSNIDDDCDKIAHDISVVGKEMIELLDAGMFTQAVTGYLQLLKSMTIHFIRDEHYCYFDDTYNPEIALQKIYDSIHEHEIDEEAQMLLDIGHSEIMDCECYQEYGYPSYI